MEISTILSVFLVKIKPLIPFKTTLRQIKVVSVEKNVFFKVTTLFGCSKRKKKNLFFSFVGKNHVVFHLWENQTTHAPSHQATGCAVVLICFSQLDSYIAFLHLHDTDDLHLDFP